MAKIDGTQIQVRRIKTVKTRGMQRTMSAEARVKGNPIEDNPKIETRGAIAQVVKIDGRKTNGLLRTVLSTIGPAVRAIELNQAISATEIKRPAKISAIRIATRPNPSATSEMTTGIREPTRIIGKAPQAAQASKTRATETKLSKEIVISHAVR